MEGRGTSRGESYGSSTPRRELLCKRLKKEELSHRSMNLGVMAARIVLFEHPTHSTHSEVGDLPSRREQRLTSRQIGVQLLGGVVATLARLEYHVIEVERREAANVAGEVLRHLLDDSHCAFCQGSSF